MYNQLVLNAAIGKYNEASNSQIFFLMDVSTNMRATTFLKLKIALKMFEMNVKVDM